MLPEKHYSFSNMEGKIFAGSVISAPITVYFKEINQLNIDKVYIPVSYTHLGSEGGQENDSKGTTEAIADINPEDIESMSVLTGAAAAALYGSHAANGAIVITTKKRKEGRLQLTVSQNTEFLRQMCIRARFTVTPPKSRAAAEASATP